MSARDRKLLQEAYAIGTRAAFEAALGPLTDSQWRRWKRRRAKKQDDAELRKAGLKQ